jgi:hypothetical protein
MSRRLSRGIATRRVARPGPAVRSHASTSVQPRRLVPSRPVGPRVAPASATPPAPAPASATVPHLSARSVLAGGPAYIPAPESLGPPPAPLRRAPVRRRLAVLLLVGLVVGAAAIAFAGTRVVLARFTDAVPVAGNTFATGTWATATTWYLHNNPTPPTANTAAQFNLPLDATTPTAATLYNYDTGCESRAGRSINRNTGVVTETGACRYATWRSTALAAARTLNGTATLTVWARKTSSGGTAPTLRAFLRVFDPATSTYVDLGQANATVTTNANQPWATYDLGWSLASVSVPAGRQIEIKLVATGANRNVEIAYDTTAYPSSLTLP